MDERIALLGVGFGMLLDDGSPGGTQFSARLIESDAGGETAEQLSHAVHASGDHGGGQVMWAGDNVGDDFCIGRIRGRGRRRSGTMQCPMPSTSR